MQIVFQNPMASLDSRQSVESILTEPLEIHRIGDKATRRARALELLEQVGLEARDIDRYPHSFSGGQLQRIAIARALALKPQLIICDEAVSALDVSIQAQIIQLLLDLQSTLGLAYLFITHNLAIVPHLAAKVAVMYLGRVVEIGDTGTVFEDPQHPYTQALLSSVLSADPAVERGRPTIELPGEVPNAVKLPSGCRFHPRCFRAQPKCGQVEPLLEQLRGARSAACFFPGSYSSQGKAIKAVVST
jgi:oligopeptide/dipeptide ABC transporter ATP-binding protein